MINPQCFAAQSQLVTGEVDHDIWRMAVRKNHRVRWWWGRRTVGKGKGAHCYVCDEVIATWDGRFEMTQQAKLDVDEHRFKHVVEVARERGTTTDV